MTAASKPPKCAGCGLGMDRPFKFADKQFHSWCLPDKEVNVQPPDGLEQIGSGTYRKVPTQND